MLSIKSTKETIIRCPILALQKAPNQPTRQKILNPPRVLISRNNYKTIESNMSIDSNWGSLSNTKISEESRRREEYQDADRLCIEAILKAAGLIPTGEINSSEAGLFGSEKSDSNEINLHELLSSAYSYIIQLKSLLHHLAHDTQNSPKTVLRWEEQIKFYHDWVEVLRVRQNVLAKKKSTLDTE